MMIARQIAKKSYIGVIPPVKATKRVSTTADVTHLKIRDQRKMSEKPISAIYADSEGSDSDNIDPVNHILVEPDKQIVESNAIFGSEGPISSSRAIARMVEPCRLSSEELQQQKIIFAGMNENHIVDQYRELRTKLLHQSRGANKVTLITSVVPEGGATHVAINLAAAFAFDTTKTALLVDCNLRNPQLHDRLLLQPQAGLTDFLEQNIFGLDSIIYATGIERLRLIPAGSRREYASELFTTMRMKALLDVLKRRFSDRHIFIDAPSIGHAADARILAEISDQVLLVIPQGKVNASNIERAVEAIGPEKLAGVVMNRR